MSEKQLPTTAESRGGSENCNSYQSPLRVVKKFDYAEKELAEPDNFSPFVFDHEKFQLKSENVAL